MSGRTTEPKLRHRLVYTDQDARDKPWLGELDEAIRNNPDCEKGIMSRQGWVFSECGPNSDGENPELLVHITEGLRDHPHGTSWYGHVFRFADNMGKGCWISMLVKTWIRSNGVDSEAALRIYRELVIGDHKWEPGYRQEPDDIFSVHGTLEEAIGALIRKIRKFRRNLRDPRIERWENPFGGVRIPIDEAPPDSELDLNCFDVYGFAEALCQELTEKERG